MVQRAGGPRLLFEALPARRVGSDIRGQYLERDLAAQSRIPRPVYLAHAARAQRRNDFIRSKPGSQAAIGMTS